MGIFAHNTFFTNMRTQNTEFHHFDHTNIPNKQTTPKTTINNFCNFLTETHPPSPTSPTYKSTTFTHQTEPFNHPSQLIGRFSSSSSLSSLFPPASSPTLSHSPYPSLLPHKEQFRQNAQSDTLNNPLQGITSLSRVIPVELSL